MVGLEHAAKLEADISAMDHRLKIWGFWCRSGGLNPELWETDEKSSRQLTTYETRDAEKLSRMVMRVPILHRLTLQVHYVYRGRSEQTEPRQKWEEVNARLRKAEVDKRISKNEYMKIWGRALRIIINSERGLNV